MNEQIQAVAITLWHEIKKDSPFFGACGLAVGWLTVAQFRLKEIGVAPKESLADALFSDFVSFNAFGFIFIGQIGLCSLVNCLIALHFSIPRLEKYLAHVEARLGQIASSIISFTVGLSFFSSGHALFTVTSQGIILAIMIAVLDCVIVVGFVLAALVARRSKPFDRWYVNFASLASALAAMSWILLFGT